MCIFTGMQYLQVCSVGEIVQWVNPRVCHLGLVESSVSSEYNIVRIHIDSVTLGWTVVPQPWPQKQMLQEGKKKGGGKIDFIKINMFCVPNDDINKVNKNLLEENI